MEHSTTYADRFGLLRTPFAFADNLRPLLTKYYFCEQAVRGQLGSSANKLDFLQTNWTSCGQTGLLRDKSGYSQRTRYVFCGQAGLLLSSSCVLQTSFTAYRHLGFPAIRLRFLHTSHDFSRQAILLRIQIAVSKGPVELYPRLSIPKIAILEALKCHRRRSFERRTHEAIITRSLMCTADDPPTTYPLLCGAVMPHALRSEASQSQSKRSEMWKVKSAELAPIMPPKACQMSYNYLSIQNSAQTNNPRPRPKPELLRESTADRH